MRERGALWGHGRHRRAWRTSPGWGLVTGGSGEGGPHSPNDVDQDHELDQAEDNAHLLVAHKHHPGGVVLKEEGSQLILDPLRHGGQARG